MRGGYLRWAIAGMLAFWPGAAGAAIGGGDVVIKIVDMPSVVFSHDFHVTRAKQKCTDCHYALFTTRAQHRPVTMAQMRAGQSCGACHNGQRAFTVNSAKFCDKCHQK